MRPPYLCDTLGTWSDWGFELGSAGADKGGWCPRLQSSVG